MKFEVSTRIFLFVALITILSGTFGLDLPALPGRLRCFKDNQPNCKEKCTSAYPHLSLSISNLTEACTWFLLYTRNNPNQPELIHECGGMLPPGTNFNPGRKLIIIMTTAILGHCNTAIFREWKDQLLIKGDYNIIVIDFTWGNDLDLYSTIQNGKIAAKQTIIVLQNIQAQTGISPRNMHVIAHSLGAHLASIFAAHLHVGRLTALDPDHPAFPESAPLDQRLDASDADLVDVWHCNAAPCLPDFGINYDAGDIDYYINGGRTQVSCFAYTLKTLVRGDLLYGMLSIVLPSFCSHYQCMQYFKESINPHGCQYVGVKCNDRNLENEQIEEDFGKGHCKECGENGENCEIMGMDFGNYNTESANAQGRYYVRTGLKCDYCDNSHVKLQGFADEYKQAVEYREKTS